MEIRELGEADASVLSNLFINMYENLDNIEGFVPILYDQLNVRAMLTNSRYYILGAFENNNLIGAVCLDYKCSDLIEPLGLDKHFPFCKIIELYHVVVHSEHRGKGAMRELLAHMMVKLQNEHYNVIFGKANKFNFSTISSYLHSEFTRLLDYNQKISKQDFLAIAEADFLKPHAKYKAQKLLERFKSEKHITLKYSILTKNL